MQCLVKESMSIATHSCRIHLAQAFSLFVSLRLTPILTYMAVFASVKTLFDAILMPLGISATFFTYLS